MKFAIYCGHSLEEWSPKKEDSGIGGSEEAVINMSRELVKLGHEVDVWNRCGEDEGIYDGVKYDNYEYFDDTKEYDITISWRNPIAFVKELRKVKGKRYLWLHDVTPEAEVLPIIYLIDKVIVLSPYHKMLYPNIPTSKIFVSQNGVNISQFNEKVKRNPNRIIYASSYDRGLKELLEMWSDIKELKPLAELHIYYGWNMIDKLGDEYKKFKEEMLHLMNQKDVFEHGRIGHKELAKEFQSSQVWAYPCWFPEISCITAMKAQISGAIPVVTPTAALLDTVKYGLTTREPRNERGTFPWGTEMSDDLKEQFVNLVVKGLDYTDRDEMMAESRKIYSWEEVAKSWVRVMRSQ